MAKATDMEVKVMLGGPAVDEIYGAEFTWSEDGKDFEDDDFTSAIVDAYGGSQLGHELNRTNVNSPRVMAAFAKAVRQAVMEYLDQDGVDGSDLIGLDIYDVSGQRPVQLTREVIPRKRG